MTDAILVGFDVDYYIGKRLKRRRKQLDLTQKALAIKIGVQHQQIQMYECAGHRMTVRRLLELSRALEVKIGYFLEGLVSDEEYPAKVVDDIMHQRETRMLVEAYSKMNPRSQRFLLEFMQEITSKEVASNDEHPPEIHLLRKAG